MLVSSPVMDLDQLDDSLRKLEELVLRVARHDHHEAKGTQHALRHFLQPDFVEVLVKSCKHCFEQRIRFADEPIQ